MRTNPFEEVERLFDRMGRQFEEAAERWDAGESLGRRSPSAAPVDLIEHDAAFEVTVDLPGFDREDVEIRITDHTLRINAERDERVEDEGTTYLRRERSRHSVSRAVQLPEAVDTEAVEATMSNGVLTVSLPRLATEPSRTIEIE